MIDERKLIEDLQSMPDKCMLFRWRSAKKIKEGLARIISAQPQIGEWIPCSERLPEEKINPVTHDFYEYPVTADFGGVKDVRYYKFGKGHWWHGAGVVDHLVTAWMPLPEPYKEEK